MKMFATIKEQNIMDWFKRYQSSFLATLLGGLIINFQLYSFMLKTPDSLWNSGVYTANAWEISLGRWAIQYADYLQFGTTFPFISVVLSLICYALANMFLLHIFDITSKEIQVIVSCLIIASPCVSMGLQYYYGNDVYALAYLFSVISIWSIKNINNQLYKYLVSTFSLAISLGFYQSYLGAAAIVAIFSLLTLINQNVRLELKDFLNKLKDYIIVFGGGVIIYYLILQIYLWVGNIEMSAYKGAGAISITSILTMLPERIIQCYRDFFVFFAGESIARNAFGVKSIYFIITMLFIVAGTSVFSKNKNWWKRIINILFILLIPLACNVINLIATSADMYLLTVGGMFLVIPLGVIFCYQNIKKHFILKRLIGFFTVILVYSFALQNNADSRVLYENYKQTTTLLNRVWYRVEQYPEFSTDMKIMIAGNPDKNENYRLASDYIKNANWYARIGLFWSTWSGSTNCWRMLIKNELGLNVNQCSKEEYKEISESEQFKNMGVYPAQSSFQSIDDILVIKISELDGFIFD